jgi:hypothetical protein
MAQFVHTVGEVLVEANTMLDVAVLTDLEGAVSDKVADILYALTRVERRIGKELAKRNWNAEVAPGRPGRSAPVKVNPSLLRGIIVKDYKLHGEMRA